MISIERILCPVTLPAESDEALRYAVSLARAYNAQLLLCHCQKPSLLLTPPGPASNNGNHSEIIKVVQDSLSRYLAPGDGSRLHAEVVLGASGNDIGEEIVRTARERRVDLIVMRARRSRIPALLGSTAEQVSRTASCPVLIISSRENTDPHSRETQSNPQTIFRRILVAHDFSSSSELALSYALSIAQRSRSELHLVHVLPAAEENEPEIALNELNADTVYHRTLHRLQASVPEEIYLRNNVIFVVRHGKPYREVLAYASEHQTDLVCMGALGRDFGLQALFGSNVDRVLRQADCPVLVARPLKPATSMTVDRYAYQPDFGKTLG